MTIEDADKIDIIARNKEGTRLSLVIADHLEWGPMESGPHLSMLQDKINLYYAYLQSDDFASSQPDAGQMELAIEVVFLYQPDDMAIEFLEIVRAELAKDGYDFVYSVTEE